MHRAPRRSRARAVAGAVGLAVLAAGVGIALPAKAPGAKATPKFDFGVNLTKVNDTTWRGRGTEKRGLGKGTMTLTGLVIGDDTTSHPTFKIKFAKGEVRGCTVTVLLRRPGDRIVVGGQGRITRASTVYRKYKGVKLALGGVMRLSNMNRIQYGLDNTIPGPPRGKC
jgi:hypothetical protein